MNLLDPALTRERYQRVLDVFHGFYAPLEVQFRRFSRSMALSLGFTLPSRAELLAKDLRVLGSKPVDRDDQPLPEIQTLAEFSGSLYVVEGAALGGQVLARSLADRWQFHRDSGTAFFSGSGPRETGRRWVSVLAWLERVAQSGAKSGDMVSAASATFRALERRVEMKLGPG